MSIGVFDPARMTPAQRAVHDRIASGPRGGVPRPFLAMLDIPDVAEAIQGVGESLRFANSTPASLRELATLATAAAFGSGYEWDYHLPLGRKAGLSEQDIAAAAGADVSHLDEIHRLVVKICRGGVLTCRIDPDAVKRLVALTNAETAATIVTIVGYYQMLALFLSAGAADHPVRHDPP